jgi:hypothetical protein
MGNPVDGAAAAQTLLDFRTCIPGWCLSYVWDAYATHGAWSNESYPTAYSAWLGSSGQHPGDWNPPKGVPVYFGPKESSSAGDVVISLGGGMCVATDYPYGGVINVCSLQDRQRQINRPYLGWADNIIGNPCFDGTAPTPIPPTIPPTEGANMFIIHNGSSPEQKILVTVDGGQLRARYLEDPYERAVILAAQPALPVAVCDDPTFDGFLNRIGYAYGQPIPLLDVNAAGTPATAASLVTPAWLVGFFLGLIGLVEVIRLVIDLIV